MRIYSGCPRLIIVRTAFRRKKKVKKIQVLFPALHEERSRRPSHSPPTVTHAHCWQQLGTGPTGSAAGLKMNKNLAGASLPVSLTDTSSLGKRDSIMFHVGFLSRAPLPFQIRDCGDLYLWICFSIHFPFNDAEERKEDQHKGRCICHSAPLWFLAAIRLLLGIGEKNYCAWFCCWFSKEGKNC